MHSRDPGSVLFGRASEADRVRVAMSTGRGVVVVGEAGIGKTVLLSETLSGRAVRHGRCFRSLSATGAAPLQHALAAPLPIGDPGWTAHWVIGRLGRAVLHLDDLQWADATTLATVELLTDRVPLAVSVRTGDPGTTAALDAVAGLERVDLAPLDPDDAIRLAARAHPRLQADEAAELARRCGGNPLLIEELGGGTESSLRRSLVRRLRRMGVEPWTGFAVVARAGEPLPATWVVALDALTEAGLLSEEGGLVRPRHPLLAETVAAHLLDNPQECRRVDLLLARRAEADGWSALAAGAYAASGDRPAALRLARDAVADADRPGMRAALLGLAAENAEGAQADELAEAAVAELVAVGEYPAAAGLMARFPQRQTASWLSLVGRVRWQTGDDDGALAAFGQARDLVAPGAREEIVLQCEYARALALSGRDTERALELARGADQASLATGRDRARALAVLGTVEHFVGLAGDVAHLRAAVLIGADDPDADLQTQFTAINNLVAALEARGDLAGAIEQAEHGATRAESLRLRGWSQQMRAMALNARLHLGDYGPVLGTAPALLDEALDRRTHDQLEVTLGLALVDLGRTEDAERRLVTALARSADDHFGRGNLTWVASEARLWSGDPERSAELAEEALTLMTGALALFPIVTLAHARSRLGGLVAVPEHEPSDLDVVAAVPFELTGLVARSTGDHQAARAAFVEAARLWRGRHRRGEQRCRWLAAEEAAGAYTVQAELETLEVELAADGWAPLLAAVRRSLRARGVRRSAPRGRAGDVTLREREVLDLVAQGLSTDAVAERLGVSPATVAAQVASARNRLGAATRWAAVSDS